VITWMIVHARPDLRATAAEAGSHYAHLGVTVQSFVLAVLAGAVISLMTRMQHAADSLASAWSPQYGSVPSWPGHSCSTPSWIRC
jgi:hypothetical protein